MVDPVSIRVARPYANEEDFLDAEAWSVTARSVLLIGVEALPEGTALRFELRLASGAALIVAEGVAVKHLAAAARPAGLVVRYKRMSAASSEFVKRAVARTGRDRLASEPEASPPPAPAPDPQSSMKSKRSSRPAARRTSSRPPTLAERAKSGRPSKQPSSAPRGMNAHGDPAAPPARSASVVPPAKRSPTVPPATRSAKAETPAPAPAEARQPGGRQPNASGRPGARSSVTNTVPAHEHTHDSSAMQRLRSRASTKPITTPPDRESILSRLKKKSSTT